MEKLLYQYGKIVMVVVSIAGIMGCILFHNTLVITLCLTIPVMCGYLLLEMKLHEEWPHYRIRNVIEKLQAYRYNSMPGTFEDVLRIMYSLDNKIYALQAIIGPSGNKKAFVEACDEYIHNAIRVVENCVERILVICTRENDQNKVSLFAKNIAKLKELLRTMDELALALTDVGSRNDDELICRIRDYARSLDDLQ